MDTNASSRSLRFGLALRPAAAAAAMLFVAGLPATALAQRAGPDQALVRVEQTYGSDVARSVEDLARDLREQGVPAAPIRDRALEGAAKDVPEEAFVSGLRSYGERLVGASESLPQSADAGAVVAAADAIQRGVSPEAVRQVAARAAGRTEGEAALSLVVLADLAGAGVPVDRALSVVRSALERGLGPREMLVTSWAVRDLIGQGRGPAAAARAVQRALARGRMPTSVAGVAPPAELPVSGGAPVPPGAGLPGTMSPPDGFGG